MIMDNIFEEIKNTFDCINNSLPDEKEATHISELAKSIREISTIANSNRYDETSYNKDCHAVSIYLEANPELIQKSCFLRDLQSIAQRNKLHLLIMERSHSKYQETHDLQWNSFSTYGYTGFGILCIQIIIALIKYTLTKPNPVAFIHNHLHNVSLLLRLSYASVDLLNTCSLTRVFFSGDSVANSKHMTSADGPQDFCYDLCKLVPHRYKFENTSRVMMEKFLNNIKRVGSGDIKVKILKNSRSIKRNQINRFNSFKKELFFYKDIFTDIQLVVVEDQKLDFCMLFSLLIIDESCTVYREARKLKSNANPSWVQQYTFLKKISKNICNKIFSYGKVEDHVSYYFSSTLSAFHFYLDGIARIKTFLLPMYLNGVLNLRHAYPYYPFFDSTGVNDPYLIFSLLKEGQNYVKQIANGKERYCSLQDYAKNISDIYYEEKQRNENYWRSPEGKARPALLNFEDFSFSYTKQDTELFSLLYEMIFRYLIGKTAKPVSTGRRSNNLLGNRMLITMKQKLTKGKSIEEIVDYVNTMLMPMSNLTQYGIAKNNIERMKQIIRAVEIEISLQKHTRFPIKTALISNYEENEQKYNEKTERIHSGNHLTNSNMSRACKMLQVFLFRELSDYLIKYEQTTYKGIWHHHGEYGYERTMIFCNNILFSNKINNVDDPEVATQKIIKEIEEFVEQLTKYKPYASSLWGWIKHNINVYPSSAMTFILIALQKVYVELIGKPRSDTLKDFFDKIKISQSLSDQKSRLTALSSLKLAKLS